MTAAFAGMNWPRVGRRLEVYLDVDAPGFQEVESRIIDALLAAHVDYRITVRPLPERGCKLALVIATSALFVERTRDLVLAALPVRRFSPRLTPYTPSL